MHYSFDNWTKAILDVNMNKLGNSWEATVNVPIDASINFTAAFNNGNGTWDNNNGQDFKTTLGSGNIDNTPPLVSILTPQNNSINISTDVLMSVEFNEVIKKGAGNIAIYENSVLKNLMDIQSNELSVKNNVLTFNSLNFNKNASVYVLIANGAIQDLAGNNFAGFSQNNQWTFTTIASTRTIEEGKNLNFEVFPNPSNSKFYLKTNWLIEQNNVKVYNVLNQEIPFESNFVHKKLLEINIANASKGIYSVLISDKTGNQIIRKLIIN
jgi:hypothetical protein